MKKLTFDHRQAAAFVNPQEMDIMESATEAARKMLERRTGPGNDFLGWHDLPRRYDRAEFRRVQKTAAQIRKTADVFIVIGIGGSYLGAKAAIEMLSHHFYNNLSADKRQGPEIYFAGTNISGPYLQHLIELIGEREVALNVISKSGTTTEPALAFRVFRRLLEQKYGREGARKRIFATTDISRGALKTLADQEGYQTFVVPDDVGGRFSVLTAVGLLPIAVAGIDINELMAGAAEAMADLQAPYNANPASQYAAMRNILYRKGKTIELLLNYEPSLHYVAEWWKQLFGESEGKDGKGIFTASADLTSDLHSLGQYMQDGRRDLFETTLEIETPACDIVLENDADNLDGLNYLTGKTFDFVNKKAAEGTVEAHVQGGVPNLKISIPSATAFHLGYLFYFFEKACAVSGYLLGVNPFDQPGVEAYKKNMFRLLGKP
jgi:glucose-6-phosphate isomerase